MSSIGKGDFPLTQRRSLRQTLTKQRTGDMLPVVARNYFFDTGTPTEEFSDIRDTPSVIAQFAPAIAEAATATDAPTAIIIAKADLLVAFSSGDAGTLVTPAKLTAATITSDTGTWALPYNGGAALDHTYVTAAAMTRRLPLNVGGALKQSEYGYRIDMTGRAGASGYEGFIRNLNSGKYDMSMSALVKFEALQNVADDVALDHFNIQSGSYAVAQQLIPYNGTAPGLLHAHGQVGAVSGRGQNILPLSTSEIYEIHLFHNYTDQKAQVALFDSAGVLVGTSEYGSGLTEVLWVFFQDYLISYGGQTTVGMIAMDWTTAAFPMNDFTMPAPTALNVIQSANNELTFSWNSLGLTAKIERSAGAGWSTLDSGLVCENGTNVYVDTTVLNGVAYTYRVTAQLNTHASSAVTSSPFTVVNVMAPVADLLQWKLNESGGTTIAAAVGGNGTTNGTLGSGYLTLNGSSQAGASNAAQNYGANQKITLSGWFNSTGWSGGGTVQCLAESSTNSGGGTNRFQLYAQWGEIGINLNDNAGNTKLYAFPVPTDNVWHHIVAVIDNATSGAHKLWIDGVQLTAGTVVNSWASAGVFSTETLYVGARASASQWFPGAIDDLRLYSGELTGSQIGVLYSNGADGESPQQASEATSAASAQDATVISSGATQVEPATAADAPSATKTTPATGVDSSTATDTASAGNQTPAARIEALTATDAPSCTVTFAASATETGTAVSTQDFTSAAAASIVEAASATDAPTVVVVFAATGAEPLAATDSASGANTAPVSVIESVTIIDAPAAIAAFVATASEAGSATSTQDFTGSSASTITEAATATDSPSAVVIFAAIQIDVASASDSPGGAATFPLSLSEAASASNVQDFTGSAGATITEAANAGDVCSVTCVFRPDIVEAGSAIDAPSARFTVNLAVTETASAQSSQGWVNTASRPRLATGDTYPRLAKPFTGPRVAKY